MQLILRDFSQSDTSLMTRHLNDPAVTRFLSSRVPKPYTKENAKWWVEVGSTSDGVAKVIEINGEFCGSVGVSIGKSEYALSAEIGYWVVPSCWNQGIATMAVSKFCDWVFDTMNLQRIYNPVTAENIASLAVMRKCGFRLEGVLRKSVLTEGEVTDEHLYARVREPALIKK